MKKILPFLFAIALLFSIAFPCYASEISGTEDTVTGDVYARYVRAIEWDNAPVVDGNAAVTTADGSTVSVSGISDYAVDLRVVPIPSTETAAWNWFSGCIGSDATILSVFDIYFEDAYGKRINADGVNISITNVKGKTTVFSVTASGNAVEISSTITNGSIRFTANGSQYYVLAQKKESAPTQGYSVIIKNTSGGSVEVSNRTPSAGETVTITPKPANGKVVNNVTVTDENGSAVKVTYNGDGTYSYTQPTGNITIQVTFKNRSGSDQSGIPATGDNSNIVLWSCVFILSAQSLWWLLGSKQRKNMR